MARSRILIVDDEEGILEVCAECLATIDAEIVTEVDSTRAAQRVSVESWDLLIADVRMPALGGVELLRLARERDPTLAVLMITAFPDVETARQCRQYGAVGFLSKQFLAQELLASSRRLLEARRA